MSFTGGCLVICHCCLSVFQQRESRRKRHLSHNVKEIDAFIFQVFKYDSCWDIFVGRTKFRKPRLQYMLLKIKHTDGNGYGYSYMQKLGLNNVMFLLKF